MPVSFPWTRESVTLVQPPSIRIDRTTAGLVVSAAVLFSSTSRWMDESPEGALAQKTRPQAAERGVLTSVDVDMEGMDGEMGSHGDVESSILVVSAL